MLMTSRATAGVVQPRGREAVGWRVGVYWRDDHVFYPGIVDDVHRPTGHHIILYDDGAPRAHTLRASAWVSGKTMLA